MATLPPKSIISGLSNDTIDYSSLFDRQTRILRIREPVELVYNSFTLFLEKYLIL